MEDELLSYVYHRLFPSPSSVAGRRRTYSDAVVALVQLHAVMRGRSPRWAVDKRNWPLWARRLKFPSYSQLMRRLKTPQVGELVERLGREARAALPHSGEKLADGKPLLVGGFSKDPDARRGKAPGGWAKGYKLHLVADACGAVDAFDVTALDAGEPTVARRLVRRLDLTRVLVRGDSNYDSNPLYRAVADRGGRLLAPRKKPYTGLGHHPQHRDRLRAIRELELCDLAREAHELRRIRIEQALAHLTNLPFGLGPLPNFVRRKHRVHRWVAAKLTLYHLYLRMRLEKAKCGAA